MAVQAIAGISFSNNCAAPSKSWCEGQCKVYVSPTDSSWSTCLDECEKHSALEAVTVVEAISNIDVSISQKCTNKVDVVGDSYVTAQHLAVRAPPLRVLVVTAPLPLRCGL